MEDVNFKIVLLGEGEKIDNNKCYYFPFFDNFI